MGLNIKNVEVERLATEVATLAGEPKTEAIRRALLERRARLQTRSGNPGMHQGLWKYLERNVWPFIPSSELGQRLSRDEEDKILGYDPGGY